MAKDNKQMRYFRVKESTEAWGQFHKLWGQYDRWHKYHAEIEKFLGFPITDNLVQDPDRLSVANVPPHLKNQFSINRDENGNYHAKKTSKLQKEWVAFAKERELYYMSVTHLKLALGLGFSHNRKSGSLFAPIDDKYYFEGYDQYEPEAVTQRNDTLWSDTDWVEEIKKSDFLRIQADWLDQCEREKSNAEESDSSVDGAQAGQ